MFIIETRHASETVTSGVHQDELKTQVDQKELNIPSQTLSPECQACFEFSSSLL